MAWSYDVSNLDLETSGGRLNVVRFLIGDTDTTNQMIQNEEITFALSATGDNPYSAAIYSAMSLSSKYASKVDVELDGELSAKYSQLGKQYRMLALDLDKQAKRFSGTNLGVSAGGISISKILTNRENEDRVPSEFRRDRFNYDVS